MTPASKIHYPARIHLANTPTPLRKMDRLSEQLGVEIYFKRDDMTGSELSGNKVRKLEFILARAHSRGADTVITCGGAQSNHCRATALAAVATGFESVLLLRTPDPSNPPPPRGNILLDRLAGARIVWITPEDYRRRDRVFRQEAERLRALGRKPFIIPEGGSYALGAWGYVSAMEEIAGDLAALGGGPVGPATVVSAIGSGGTTAGLLLGARMLDLDVRVVGVNVCEDRDYFLGVIGAICSDFCETFSVPSAVNAISDLTIVDGYVGRGYALSRPEELKAIGDLARLEAVVLDPVYTGKAFFGMVEALRKDPRAFGPRIVFIHTGGLFGLFPVADEMAEVLS